MLKLGLPVRLVTGGPAMVITRLPDEKNPDTCAVKWFEGMQLKADAFPSVSLAKVHNLPHVAILEVVEEEKETGGVRRPRARAPPHTLRVGAFALEDPHA